MGLYHIEQPLRIEVDLVSKEPIQDVDEGLFENEVVFILRQAAEEEFEEVASEDDFLVLVVEDYRSRSDALQYHHQSIDRIGQLFVQVQREDDIDSLEKGQLGVVIEVQVEQLRAHFDCLVPFFDHQDTERLEEVLRFVSEKLEGLLVLTGVGEILDDLIHELDVDGLIGFGFHGLIEHQFE